MLKKYGQPLVYKLINPLINLLIKLKVSPNTITTIGLIINVGAAVVFIVGAETAERSDLSYVGWAGALILFGGLFDMIDGRLARIGNMSSTYGALYDSVLDRWSEIVMFFGVAYFLISHDYFLSSMFVFFALTGSVMVSYTRARAEGLGIDCSVGVMQRPERVIIVGVSSTLCGIISDKIGGDYKFYSETLNMVVFETISIMTTPILIVAILANYTAIERLGHSRKVLKEKEG
ncbi:MAG: CDP-alcohol phosphatidyltransferase family protein [Cyclobacteriaceae bacterium]